MSDSASFIKIKQLLENKDLTMKWGDAGRWKKDEIWSRGLWEKDAVKAEYLPRHLQEYVGNNGIVKRNGFAERMYTDACVDCIAHKETTFVCDLCEHYYVLEYVLEVEHENPAEKQWLTAFPQHECQEAKRYLSLVLHALL